MIKKVERKSYMVPRFPDYPQSEWNARITKARELMTKNGVDCLLLWERENIRYFFGFQTVHWCGKSIQSAVGIIPLEGEPILIVPSLLQGNVEGLCWVNDIRISLDAHQPKVTRELPREVAGLIKEIGYGNKRIALETGPLGCMYIPRPLNDIESLKAALSGAKIVDGDKVIWGCRMIKSALEIDRIRKSIDAVTAVELAIVEGYRPGMMETDLMKVINRARAEQEGMGLGDDTTYWSEFICSPDKFGFADIMALEGAPITKDHAIQWDGTCFYKGYGPDSARLYQVGPVTPETRLAYDTIFAGEDAAGAILKPGVRAKDVYEAMYKPAKDLGWTCLDMGGHGTGMDTHEPPSIDAWNEQLIEEGMVLSIEPWVSPTGKFWFGIQDQYLVTNKGSVLMPGLDRNIVQVYRTV
jgi:Xaa-Pro aminopeptidase